jgi:hypothetical protein
MVDSQAFQMMPAPEGLLRAVWRARGETRKRSRWCEIGCGVSHPTTPHGRLGTVIAAHRPAEAEVLVGLVDRGPGQATALPVSGTTSAFPAGTA